MSLASEENITLALHAYRSKTIPSLSKAAAAYGISKTTLWRRNKGHSVTKTQGHEHQQRLSHTQESFLCDWIINLDRQGLPPSFPRVKDMVTRILRENGDVKPLGQHWIRQFLKRNQRIRAILGVKIHHKRIEGTQWEVMKDFYDRFSETMKRYHVSPDHIWNMDETGLHVGKGSNGRVLGENRGKSKTYARDPDIKEWVTIIECINAAGSRLRPLVIFKGRDIQSTWFSDTSPDWRYTTSVNGWTSNELGLEWFTNSFLKEAVPPAESEIHTILVMDNHASHTTPEIQHLCLLHHVHIVFLPPHSSHILQPLDLSYFGPLKQRCKNIINNLSEISDALPLKKYKFLDAFSQARDLVTPLTILSGWSATGLHPFDPKKGLHSRQMRDLRAERREHHSFRETETEHTPQINRSAETIAETPAIASSELLKTPRSHKQRAGILKAIGTATPHTHRRLERNLNRVFASLVTKNAELEDQLQKKTALLQEQQKKRKRVRTEQGGKIVEIKDIERVNQKQKEQETADKAKEAQKKRK